MEEGVLPDHPDAQTQQEAQGKHVSGAGWVGGWGGSVVPLDHPEPQKQETLGNPKEEQAGEGAFRPSDVQTHPGVQTQCKTQVCQGFR